MLIRSRDLDRVFRALADPARRAIEPQAIGRAEHRITARRREWEGRPG